MEAQPVEPAVSSASLMLALLVQAYHAGITDSPEGFLALSAIRRLLLARGWDIHDLSEPKVERALQLAAAALEPHHKNPAEESNV